MTTNSSPSAKIEKHDLFSYAYIEPHLLVRSVEMHVNMLPTSKQNDKSEASENKENPKQNGDSEANDQQNGEHSAGKERTNSSSSSVSVEANEDVLTSEVQPFRMPLPLPPNCKLFRQLQNQHVQKMSDPIEFITPSTSSQQQQQQQQQQQTSQQTSQQAKESSSTTSNTRESVERRDSNADDGYIPKFAPKIPIVTGIKKRGDAPKLEKLDPPYNSVNLKYNSMGYVYEDIWNVDQTRPLIAKVLLKEDYKQFNIEPKKKEEKSETTEENAEDQSKSKEQQKQQQQKQQEQKQQQQKQQQQKQQQQKQQEQKQQEQKQQQQKQQEQKQQQQQQEEKSEEQINIEYQGVDRSDWQTKVLEKHPYIRELRERIYPLWRAISFGQAFDAGLKEVKNSLTDEHILNIILQHLTFEGLKRTKKALEKESGQSYKWIDTDQSLIHAILKEAIKKTERIYDIVICDKMPLKERQRQKNAIIKEIDEYLGELGIEDEAGGQGGRYTDIDIWEESDQDKQQNMIVEVDPITAIEHFYAGSLNVLVERLTTIIGEQDMQFIHAFLTTYQSFSTPEILFTKLMQRFNVPEGSEFNSKKSQIQNAVCTVIRNWVEHHFFHFDAKLMQKIVNFVHTELEPQHELQKQAEQIKRLIELHSKGEYIEPKTTKGMEPKPPPAPKVDMNKIFKEGLILTDLDEEEVARQMSMYEFEFFKKIQEQELLNQAWIKTKLKHRAPNVLKMNQHFNDISMWVAGIICSGEPSTTTTYHRKHRMKVFIKICEHLKSMNNFNTLKAILDGLQNPAVQRLSKAKEELAAASKQKLSELVMLMSNANNNYTPYREALKYASKPCIPYLGVTLQDLVLIDTGNVDFVKHGGNNLINWAKREMLYDVISEVKKYQKQPYNFISVYQIQVIMQKMEKRPKSQQELMEMSNIAEPPSIMSTPSFANKSFSQIPQDASQSLTTTAGNEENDEE